MKNQLRKEVHKFNVKEGSLRAFMLKNMTDPPNNYRDSPTSDYYYLKDRLLFKKDGELKVGEKLEITLSDRGEGSKKRLCNQYIYEIRVYDDVSVELVLISFDVVHDDLDETKTPYAEN